jgi:exopolyphosphatase / guanosine-5'-triphosphate,3'-diphosphate pyrophosphatase
MQRAANGAASEVIAAVDLGSNSFHMIVGELRQGQLTILDRLRETVRLSEGLTRNGNLSPVAQQRALECLSRFGQRLHDMKAANVRAAGTSALRRARDSRKFRDQAQLALGHPIEVISGIEEARLIYAGVTHSMPATDGLRLVLDIGGGSTELILGEGRKPKALESLQMGCVAMTEAHFVGGVINEKAFESARVTARLKLRPVKAFFRDSPVLEATGTSGTIRASETVARELGIIESNDLTRAAVSALIERVLDFDQISEISLPGLSDRRAQVWPGGLAILIELLTVLRVDRLRVSDGALREGLLYESLGRLRHEDARERSVIAFTRRFHVDPAQADRVAGTAAVLFRQCAAHWDLDSPMAVSLLGWAAQLHEIGLDIAHGGFHRHGAYIVANADMPGFPRNEQRILAFMIRNQRGALDLDYCSEMSAGWQQAARRLTVILRLAVLLNRSRSTQQLPSVKLEVSAGQVKLLIPRPWLQSNPLSVADLARESRYLAEVGIDLNYE